MENLTQEQRTQIALEEYGKEPTQMIAHLAILKLAELGISTNAETVTQTTEAKFNGKRYDVEMIVSYKEQT
jgi:hypothetical protein